MIKWLIGKQMKKLFGYSPLEVAKWKEILFVKDGCNSQEALRFMIEENEALKEERDIALQTARETIAEHNKCRESLRDLKETVGLIRDLSHPEEGETEYRKAYSDIIEAADRAMRHTDIM